MKKFSIVLAAAVVLVTPGLVGCGPEMSTAPSISHADVSLSPESDLTGKQLFDQVNNEAIGSLSLSDVVLLTPYITGSKLIGYASLSEIVQLTPAVTRFQAAFNASMSTLSAGDAVKVTRYMGRAGLNRFPYPVPELG